MPKFFFFSSDKAGPEPEYDNIASGFKTHTFKKPFSLRYRGGILPEVTVAYETWGQLSANRDNAVLISTGLSASSHARSHEVGTHVHTHNHTCTHHFPCVQQGGYADNFYRVHTGP